VTTADVVVIGGGVNGTSAAFHLASLKVKKVILVERRHLGAGATGKSGALVRMHYTNPYESRLAFESLKIFQQFDEIVGGNPGFEPVGFIHLVPPGYEERLARNVAAQRSIGVDTHVIDHAALRELMPGCSLDDVGAAAHEPGSGYADPNATTFAFAAAARRLGVELWQNCEATEILTGDDGRVVAVETTQGRISTAAVVLAPGVWGQPLLDPLGLDFGLKPYRIQVTIFRWPEAGNGPRGVVTDAIHHAWMRPAGPQTTLIGVEMGVEDANLDGFSEIVDAAYVQLCREKLTARFPSLGDAVMRGGWAGMVMMSPDSRPIIDQIPSVPGLYTLLGDSGTSFKTAPVIGKCLAEWVVYGEPQTADLTPFRSTRFAEGAPWRDVDNYSDQSLTISR
jgi:sarcosine oxidase subunit beta